MHTVKPHIFRRVIRTEVEQLVRVEAIDLEAAKAACALDDSEVIFVLQEGVPVTTEIEITEIRTSQEELALVQAELDEIRANGWMVPGRQFELRGGSFFTEEDALRYWKSRLRIAN